jgi:hypothetical protein
MCYFKTTEKTCSKCGVVDLQKPTFKVTAKRLLRASLAERRTN